MHNKKMNEKFKQKEKKSGMKVKLSGIFFNSPKNFTHTHHRVNLFLEGI